MILKEETHLLNGKTVTLRSARKDEAQMLIDYLKTVSYETRFLLCEPDEIKFTIEDEEKYISEHNKSTKALLMLAFVDGEYAGNCSFEVRNVSQRQSHRAEIGIALYQKFTGLGIGKLMLTRLLEEMKHCGLEQAELSVYGNNEIGLHLYETLGFTECGRIPNAAKYSDGTYDDEILMTLKL